MAHKTHDAHSDVFRGRHPPQSNELGTLRHERVLLHTRDCHDLFSNCTGNKL